MKSLIPKLCVKECFFSSGSIMNLALNMELNEEEEEEEEEVISIFIMT